MNEWVPEPGDDAYHVVTIDVTSRESVGVVSEAEAVPDPMTYETKDVSLLVRIEDASRTTATIEQFGKTFAVPIEQLHEEPYHPDRVYPAHEGSPYTSLDDVIEELRSMGDR